MNVRESDLPGIGKKFELMTDNDDKVVVVIHDDGRREVYHYDDDDWEESISGVTFTDSEARQLASIIGGMTYKPKAVETIEVAFDDLVIEWYKLGPSAPIIGKTIGEIGIRQNYNINIIGIIRKDHSKQLNPGVDSIFKSGDTLVISGERADLKRANNELFLKERG
jgi:TrkA domain protein